MTNEIKPEHRAIKSFVLRQGRMTVGQERAFAEIWPVFGIEINAKTPQITSQNLFGDEREIVLEIGFGNGESFLKMAEAEPEKGFIGIEVHGPGVGHALIGIEEKGLKNVRLLRHDAVEILKNNIPDNQLSRVQVYFPDPWQKARHHKRRLIQKTFTDLLHQKLREGGELHCATDWENYAQWMRDVLLPDPSWHNLGHRDGYIERPKWRPETKFERRGLGKGHGVWDLRYTALK